VSEPDSVLGAACAGESPDLDEVLREVARAPPADPGSPFAPLAPGAVIGRFELVRELGRGGFGVVYEARDRELGRLVAFKAMRPARTEPDALVAPLHEEAEAAARLNHPNVVTLHDFGIHQGTPYLILELLRGETLQDKLRRGPLPAGEAIRIGLDVARGLVHAHAQDVLHRDLKPGNVFLTAGGGAKILDFGLARLLNRAALKGGTPAYMAPEQLRGEPGDARTDVFALGVILYQALSGSLPYPTSAGQGSVLDPGPPPPLPVEDAPPELAAFLAGALSKDPAGRPQSAQAVLESLAEVERALETRAEKAARAARRRRLRRLLAAAAAILLLAAYGVAVAAVKARARAERALLASRVASAAEGAFDPLLATLLMAELPDDPPPRAVEIAQRILAEPIPVAELELPGGGSGLAVSPDGAWLAAGAGDGGATLWRTDGTASSILAGGGSETVAVRFTPDGERILCAGRDGMVRVFRRDGSEPPRSFSASGAPLLSLDVDRSGRFVAAAGVDGRLWLFDLTGRRLPRVLLHDGAVFAVAWSPDGSRIATGSADGLVRTFDAAGSPIARVDLRGGAVFGLAWSPDGRLATAAEDGALRVLSQKGQLLEVHGGGPPANAVDVDPAGSQVIVALADGTARILPLGAAGPEVVLRGHRGPILRATFLRGGRRVLTVGTDGTARIWRADGAGTPIVLRGQAAQEAAMATDGARVFTRGPQAVRVWDSDDPRERDVLRGHELAVASVRWTRDGQRVLTAGHDGTARFWAVHGGEPLVMHDPGNTLHSADVDPAETLLLTASEDGVVRIWEASSGALEHELRGHEGPVLSAAFSPDGRSLASGSLDRTVRIWRTDGSGEPLVLRGHAGGVTGVAFSPDGERIVSASSYDATVRVWLRSGAVDQVIHAEHPVERPAFAPDGTLLVAEEGGPLRRFRPDGVELPPMASPPEGLLAAAASADGARVALTSIDGTVRVYAAGGDGEPLLLRAHEGPVNAAAFSPDGAELATASEDGTARVFTVDWMRLRARLRRSTTICLKTEARVQLLAEDRVRAAARAEACVRERGHSPTVDAPQGGER